MVLGIESPSGFRNGVVQMSFDPARLRFVRAEPGTLLGPVSTLSFNADAPDGAGRLSLSFAAQSDIRGSGEAARMLFRTVPGSSGVPELRTESVSLSDAGNRTLPAEPPAPLTLGKAQ